ncbi:MAG: hypothetical protein MK008_04290 [Bdellovibrionales bacterium]|nr:hypothetical protein [Bdellovibrionales bacterium]
MNNLEFMYIQSLLLEKLGISLEDSKEYLVQSRLNPIAQAHGMNNYHDLVKYLRINKDNTLIKSVLEAMLTHETYFFRDVKFYDSLKDHVIPEIIKNNRHTKELKILSCACSTGQEPYSLAIMLTENFPELASWNISIKAFDYSANAIEKAKSACYTSYEVNRGLSEALISKYFTNNGKHWTLRSDIRNLVYYFRANLLENLPDVSAADLLLLRNVLIYFDLDNKKNILKSIQTYIKPSGYLFLGSGETTLGLTNELTKVRINNCEGYQLLLS